jgi:hypothetical protein
MTKPRTTSTKRLLASMLLAFQSFVMFFATLVAFGLKVADPRLVWGVGLTLSVLLILTPAILGRPGSYAWGWALQVLCLFTGVWVPLMWLVGIIFMGLWAWGMIAGGTIDKAREVYLRNQAQPDTEN